MLLTFPVTHLLDGHKSYTSDFVVVPNHFYLVFLFIYYSDYDNFSYLDKKLQWSTFSQLWHNKTISSDSIFHKNIQELEKAGKWIDELKIDKE
jgi:hypothetical protein